ncbi:MAG TPA: glutaredoxin 3 [Hyphomonadaceae bacterium]|jgi:glutaredoxin 3|nr:glutaredoxin 3 [Hyphomonadaceae bacterium]
MPEVEIYTTPICPYCVRAKSLFDKKGVSYKEIDVAADPAIRDAMIKRAGGKRTVPQIFINGHHVGGSDDLYALERKGELDQILEPV